MRCQYAPVDTGGMHPQQHLVGARLRPVDLLEPQDVGLTVDVLDDRLHRRSVRPEGSAAVGPVRCSVPITLAPWCSPSLARSRAVPGGRARRSRAVGVEGVGDGLIGRGGVGAELGGDLAADDDEGLLELVLHLDQLTDGGVD